MWLVNRLNFLIIPVSHLGLVSHQLPALGFNLTSSIVLSMLTSKIPNHLFFNFFTVFLKDQSLVLYFSFYTPLLLVQSYLIHQQIITSMLMILNFFLSFSAADFSYNITHLENTISNVYNWMSSNFLSLNPSNTEFLIIYVQ